MTGERPLRHAVIGVGAGILGEHRPALALPDVEVAAVCDLSPVAAARGGAEFGCPHFTDHRALLRAVRPDVVVVLTPPFAHAPVAIDCLEAGAHVLVEKPMAVSVGEADALVATAARTGRLLAVVLQHRGRPEVRTAHRLLAEGAVGVPQHVALTAVWTRTASYFASGAWRATWRGEGGGVLAAQAPHHLDLLVHLLGRPAEVVAWNRTQLHPIETEDTVDALLRWPSGAVGSVHISTAEVGPAERLEITGTGGTLRLSGDDLALDRFGQDLREFVAAAPGFDDRPAVTAVPIALEAGDRGHLPIYRNLHRAIRTGEPLLADGAQGREPLELAAALTLSSHTGRPVRPPVDRAAYDHLLRSLMGGTPPA